MSYDPTRQPAQAPSQQPQAATSCAPSASGESMLAVVLVALSWVMLLTQAVLQTVVFREAERIGPTNEGDPDCCCFFMAIPTIGFGYAVAATCMLLSFAAVVMAVRKNRPVIGGFAALAIVAGVGLMVLSYMEGKALFG